MMILEKERILMKFKKLIDILSSKIIQIISPLSLKILMNNQKAKIKKYNNN